MDIDKLLSEIDAEIQRIVDEAASREDKSLTAEELERIEALERRFDLYHSMREQRGQVQLPNAVLSAIGATAPQPEQAPLLKVDQRMAQGPSNFSLGKTLRGLVTGNWKGAEEELRAIGVGAGGSALVPEQLARVVIDLARAKTVSLQAGALTMPMDTSEMVVPMLQADPEAQWRDEHGEINQDDPAFTSARLTAKSLAVLSVMSRELVEDSPLAEQAVMRSITAAMAGALDRAILAGAGVGPEPLGILNTSGIHSIEAAGAAITWEDIIDGVAKIAAANRQANAVLMHPNTRAELAKIPGNTENGWQAMPEYLRGLTFLDTTALEEGTVVIGDFSNLIVGIREMLTLRVLTERFADTGEVGIVAHIRADCVAVDPQAFAVVAVAEDDGGQS